MGKSTKAITACIIGIIYISQTVGLSVGESNEDIPAQRENVYKVVRTFEANVSAYTVSVEECGKDDGITASGEPIQEGHVASDDLPFGTILEIEGERYKVTDRFGGNYRERVDIFMPSRHDALRFGRQRLQVMVLEEISEGVLE